MNRIQKKCLTVSVGIHLLLAVILIVGPKRLMPSEDKPQSMELLPLDSGFGQRRSDRRWRSEICGTPSPDKEDSQPIAQVPTPPQPQPQAQPVVTPPQPQPLPKPEVVKAPTPEPKVVKPDALIRWNL